MPGSKNYMSAMSKSYSMLAREEQPPCIVTPSSSAQVACLLREAAGRGASVTARGGGHTMRLPNHFDMFLFPLNKSILGSGACLAVNLPY